MIEDVLPRWHQWCQHTHGHQLARQPDGEWMRSADVERRLTVLATERDNLLKHLSIALGLLDDDYDEEYGRQTAALPPVVWPDKK